MEELNTQAQQDQAAFTASIEIVEVVSIRETADTATTGGLILVLSWTAGSNQDSSDKHLYRPDDPYGLNPVIKQWLVDNPEFPITPYTPPPELTDEEKRAIMPALTARQFRLGLVQGGISPDTVSTTISNMPAGADRDKAKIEWEYATAFNRLHPLIATVSTALGLTPAQVDAMWLAAVNL